MASLRRMHRDDQQIHEFLTEQSREFGGNLELEAGLWTLFAVPAADAEGNALVQSLLASATFAHDAGASEDDQWMIYFVDTATRAEAVYWLEDQTRLAAGEIRPASLAQRTLINDLVGSNMPHRLAQQLVELHQRGEISAGIVREAPVVRGLLDRLHGREPIFFSAFLPLLSNHLIDMVVLLRQIIGEDLALQNELMSGSLSRDPFLQSRQTAAADIRSFLMRFHVISSFDQAKSTAIDNPYAAYLEIARHGDQVVAMIDGVSATLSSTSLVRAIRAVRRNLYRGGHFNRVDTQSPWMDAEIASAFRFIKQRLEMRRELTPMDGLYMLERAVTT